LYQKSADILATLSYASSARKTWFQPEIQQQHDDVKIILKEASKL